LGNNSQLSAYNVKDFWVNVWMRQTDHGYRRDIVDRSIWIK